MTNLPPSARVTDRTDLMAEVVEAAQPRYEDGPRMASYASDLFILMECPRRYYWDRTAPIRDDRSWFIIAEVGNHIHSLLVDFFKRAGRWRGDEVRGGAAEVNLSYRMDLLINDAPAGQPESVVPVEIKSCNDSSWVGKTYNGHPEWTRIGYRAAPGFAHYLQLQAYLHFHKPTPYNYGYLLYLNKNGPEKNWKAGTSVPEYKLWRVEYDAACGAEIERALGAHEFSVINELLPGADKSKEACKFCPYGRRCADMAGPKLEAFEEASAPTGAQADGAAEEGAD